MEKHEEDLILSLLGKDTELKHYYEEHLELEKRLASLQHKHYLTPSEDLEKRQIQKVKLAGKDKMMEILDRYR